MLEILLVLSSLFVGANISDGEERLAFITEEDKSISVYKTLNGTTEKITPGYDNLTDFMKNFMVPEFHDRMQSQNQEQGLKVK